MNEPLNGTPSAGDDKFDKDVLSSYFNVQDIYPEDAKKEPKSHSLLEFLRNYRSVDTLVSGLGTSMEKGI